MTITGAFYHRPRSSLTVAPVMIVSVDLHALAARVKEHVAPTWMRRLTPRLGGSM